MPLYKQILASILLLCQINIMTSHPVVNEGEQKQNAFYRDNATSSVIREQNALQRNAGSSDRRHGALNNFLSLLSAHARMVRSSGDCIESRGFFSCGKDRIPTVICQKASFACAGVSLDAACQKEMSVYSCNGKRYKFVTGCRCS